MTWGHIKDLLKIEFPIHYEQLASSVDEEGFISVGAKDGSFFEFWRKGKDIKRRETLYRKDAHGTPKSAEEAPRSLESLILDSNIWEFTRAERAQIIKLWENLCNEEWIDKLIGLSESHENATRALDLLTAEYHRRILETADVIGLTTTGLARNTFLLESLKSKTLICEEAGEVLEVSPL